MALYQKRIISVILSLLLVFSWGISTIDAQEIIISENAADSASEVSVQEVSQTAVSQTNQNQSDSSISSSSETGGNSSSENTQSDAQIITGSSTTQVQIEESGNTSTVSSGCCDSTTSVTVLANGSESSNNVNLIQSSQTTISVNNTATITNNIQGVASTGGNTVSQNTNGSVSIKTGDIKAGSFIVNSPINTASVDVKTGIPGTIFKIAENAADSQNDITADFINQVNVYQNFASDIQNYIIWDLTTGENSANENLQGDVKILTGDITLEVFITNFVNIGGVKIDCCPLEKEEREKEKPTGGVPEEKEQEEKKEDGVKGQILPEAAAVEAGGPGIDGLAPTSSNQTEAIFFILGLALLAIGGKIATEEILPTSSKNKN